MMNQSPFKLHSAYVPTGDQPEAIDSLVANLEAGVPEQILLGVTGSGKTFTMANVIARCGRPALVLAPNKTLAAQLYNEFREFFPQNAVEYFVSYYDYYQPEAYVPASDTYIEKDSSINDNIDKLRHAATHALLTRRDVIIVASVSCIYGLGSPEFYARMIIPVEVGQHMSMDALITRLVEVQYERNDYDFHRGTFRVRGDVLEIIPAYHHERALRIEFFGDDIDSMREVDPLTGDVLAEVGKTVIYPASHFVSAQDNLKRTTADIRQELLERLTAFKASGRLVEAQRLEQRTQLDLEMIEELGYCNGHNTKLNCLEFHRDSEFNLGTDDFILLLATLSDLEDGELDTAKVKAFKVPAGVMVEVYATTLHYAPCHADAKKGFRVMVALPDQTNTDFRPEDGANKLDKTLWARNKWLLAHPDSSEAKQGAAVLLKGENIDIAGDI